MSLLYKHVRHNAWQATSPHTELHSSSFWTRLATKRQKFVKLINLCDWQLRKKSQGSVSCEKCCSYVWNQVKSFYTLLLSSYSQKYIHCVVLVLQTNFALLWGFSKVCGPTQSRKGSLCHWCHRPVRLHLQLPNLWDSLRHCTFKRDEQTFHLYVKSLHQAGKNSYSTTQTCGVILPLLNSCL